MISPRANCVLVPIKVLSNEKVGKNYEGNFLFSELTVFVTFQYKQIICFYLSVALSCR